MDSRSDLVHFVFQGHAIYPIFFYVILRLSVCVHYDFELVLVCLLHLGPRLVWYSDVFDIASIAECAQKGN